MTDRDRLAADLGEDCAYPEDVADRLIALGWTQRPLGYWSAEGDLYPEMVDRLRDVLPEAWAQGKQIVVADGVTLRFHELPPTLDEERLARALHRAFHRGHSGDGCEPTYRHGKDAKVIARAYREDTDDRP